MKTFAHIFYLNTVDENIIGAPKMQNIFLFRIVNFSNITIAILDFLIDGRSIATWGSIQKRSNALIFTKLS